MNHIIRTWSQYSAPSEPHISSSLMLSPPYHSQASRRPLSDISAPKFCMNSLFLHHLDVCSALNSITTLTTLNCCSAYPSSASQTLVPAHQWTHHPCMPAHYACSCLLQTHPAHLCWCSASWQCSLHSSPCASHCRHLSVHHTPHHPVNSPLMVLEKYSEHQLYWQQLTQLLYCSDITAALMLQQTFLTGYCHYIPADTNSPFLFTCLLPG